MHVIALLLLLAGAAAAQVTFERHDDRISVAVDGQPFTELFYGKDAGKPYLHPLRSASGKLVTRQFPMADVASESKDHPHHRGLWFSHGDVNGFNFWAGEPSQRDSKTGIIRVVKVGSLRGGDKSGTLQAQFEWVDPNGHVLLTEDRTMVFYSDPANRKIDFDILLTAASQATFADTKEGIFAIRLASELDETRTGRMTNSLGAQSEKDCWGKRAAWMDYAGQVQGEELGVAIFDHPGNPHHPTYWHARAYGLFAANAFGAHDFEGADAPSGAMTLERGQTMRFRYRVLIHPGKTGLGALAKEYAEYGK